MKVKRGSIVNTNPQIIAYRSLRNDITLSQDQSLYTYIDSPTGETIKTTKKPREGARQLPLF